MNNFEINDRADDIAQSMTPYAMAKRIIELEGKRQAAAVPYAWRTELKKIADMLDRDGDEYGCAARINDLLVRDAGTVRVSDIDHSMRLALLHLELGIPPASEPAEFAYSEMSKAVADVIAERHRQINAEGWTPEHDDGHDQGDMAIAGACYAAHASKRGIHASASKPMLWPWDASWWKPTDDRRDLVKAGALIIAEIERLDRAAAIEAMSEGEKQFCNYPNCNCPLDAPADPNWCARGLPHENAMREGDPS